MFVLNEIRALCRIEQRQGNDKKQKRINLQEYIWFNSVFVIIISFKTKKNPRTLPNGGNGLFEIIAVVRTVRGAKFSLFGDNNELCPRKPLRTIPI